jgi:hypothetical protein
MMASTSAHAECDKETGGLEVAKAFVDHIGGKKSTTILLLTISHLEQ